MFVCVFSPASPEQRARRLGWARYQSHRLWRHCPEPGAAWRSDLRCSGPDTQSAAGPRSSGPKTTRNLVLPSLAGFQRSPRDWPHSPPPETEKDIRDSVMLLMTNHNILICWWNPAVLILIITHLLYGVQLYACATVPNANEVIQPTANDTGSCANQWGDITMVTINVAHPAAC